MGLVAQLTWWHGAGQCSDGQKREAAERVIADVEA